MIRFECDYGEGCHENILKALSLTNLHQTETYGEDMHCKNAGDLIKKACNNDKMDVHFLVGGTQANTTVISSILRPHQGVISPKTGHIACHETGAIEATGHKVIELDTKDGKLYASDIALCVDNHYADSAFEHMPQPAMVYISQPTEGGLIYSKAELEELYKACCQRDIALFIDGARLGFALACKDNDLSLEDLSNLCHVFYIGGTKMGALFGEAVCICDDRFKKDFRYHIKQHGGMLAKGRLLGIQFETLFEDGLYFEIGKKAVEQALKIRDALKEAGVKFWCESPTNQQFPILTMEQHEELSKNYAYRPWEIMENGEIAVRFVTSFATTDENVETFCSDILKLKN